MDPNADHELAELFDFGEASLLVDPMMPTAIPDLAGFDGAAEQWYVVVLGPE